MPFCPGSRCQGSCLAGHHLETGECLSSHLPEETKAMHRYDKDLTQSLFTSFNVFESNKHIGAVGECFLGRYVPLLFLVWHIMGLMKFNR